jgi:hypothetical protein
MTPQEIDNLLERVEQEPDSHLVVLELVTAVIELRNSHREMLEALKTLTRLWSDFSDQEMYGEHLRAGLEPEDFECWTDAHDTARAAIAKAESKQEN